MTDDDLRERLRAGATDHDGETAELLASAASRLDDQQATIEELQTELEETNEGMVALTLELEAAERRYRSLFENAVEGIYKTTPDGSRYVMANGSMAEILGYDSPESLERAVADIGEDVFVDPDRYETYRSRLRTGEPIENFEYRVRRADGEVRWVSDNARTLYEDGEAAGFRGGIIDITALKEYEQQLETLNSELEALNRVVRHDIRNDMQIIRGFATHLERQVDAEHTEPVERILETTEHIIDLTENAREFIETLGDTEAAQLEPTEIDTHLRYELEQHREAYPDVSYRVPREFPSVTVMANGMLSSVFRNLLNNAVQHNDSDTPVVAVACTETGETVEIRIADNGRGVPDDRKEEIFGKGEQSVDSDGTGIGLYLVHQLVSTYGGDVWVEDGDGRLADEPAPGASTSVTDGDSGGAVFVIRLPKAGSHGQTAEAPR